MFWVVLKLLLVEFVCAMSQVELVHDHICREPVPRRTATAKNNANRGNNEYLGQVVRTRYHLKPLISWQFVGCCYNMTCRKITYESRLIHTSYCISTSKIHLQTYSNILENDYNFLAHLKFWSLSCYTVPYHYVWGCSLPTKTATTDNTEAHVWYNNLFQVI